MLPTANPGRGRVSDAPVKAIMALRIATVLVLVRYRRWVRLPLQGHLRPRDHAVRGDLRPQQDKPDEERAA